MENHVLPQLQLLLLSVLLGAAGAFVYDMLRSIRLRSSHARLMTQLLDGLFVVLAALALGAFGFRQGGGEVRPYILLYTLLGAALYYLLAAPLLRPLWSFWADTAAQLLRLMWLPAKTMGRFSKKLCKLAKKDFHFLRRYATIKRYKWDFLLVHRGANGKGGRVHREKGKKDKARSRFHHHAGADRSDGGDRH
jgi:spore cortex biosynthesis protein YabQ